ncbi:MAG: LacI family DNA-binding transcriptional regulator [Cytophagales bacterium]|nr:LacI family DNA-binding transcriptional regulator [Cytophagales bacterium]
MNQRKTIKDVAAAANVSIATVSRVFSKPGAVRIATREWVTQVAQTLNYQPDAAARALVSGRTYTVGCAIPTLDHAIFARSTQAMQTALAEARYQLLVGSYEYDPKVECEVVQALLQRGVDALVLVGTKHAPELWKTLSGWSKPVLLTWACDPRLPSVGFDNHAIAALATQHLLDLGHRRIGMISGFTANNDRAEARVAGLRDTLALAGLLLPSDTVSEQIMAISGGRLGLIDLLHAKNPPTAILCGNDMLAAGALLEAQRQGLNVPLDLSICGIDNHEMAAEMNPALTTVSLPTQELGRIAAAQVLAALASEPIAKRTLLPFELMIRGTTARPR